MPEQMRSITVFYRPEITADAGSYSPSATKPTLVVDDWVSNRLPIDLRSFDPVDEDTLALAHDREVVRGVLACEIANGFGNRLPAVAASLRFTSAAMLAAAHEAIANARVACAPVSGFHHACHGHAGAFCTFNGLVVTALALKRDGLAERVGILDLDHHYGNGTDDIIHRLRLQWVRHESPGRRGPTARDAEPYLARLADIVNGFADCQVLLYQAGADAHIDDPLGGWMSSEQLERRDRIVFEAAARLGLPVAWNLAGGYQRDARHGIEPVLAIHRRTMVACAAVHIDDEGDRVAHSVSLLTPTLAADQPIHPVR